MNLFKGLVGHGAFALSAVSHHVVSFRILTRFLKDSQAIPAILKLFHCDSNHCLAFPSDSKWSIANLVKGLVGHGAFSAA